MTDEPVPAPAPAPPGSLATPAPAGLPDDAAAPARKSNPWVSVLKATVVVSVVVYLVASGRLNLADVLRTLSNVAWWTQAVPLVATALVVVSLRWWVFLRAEEIYVSPWEAIRLSLIGHFWNNVLPGAVTGDFVKMYCVGRHTPGRRAEAFTTVMLDRVVGLAALVAISFVAALGNLDFIFDPAHPELRRTFYAMIGCLAAFFVGGGALVLGVGRKSSLADAVRARAPFVESVRRAYRTLLRFGQARRAIALTLAMSFVSHGLLVVVAIVSGRALGENKLSLVEYGFLVPIGLFANSIPIGSPGGAGVGEGAFSKLFGWAGWAQGAEIMLLNRVAQLALGLIGAVLYVADKRARAALASPSPENA